MPVVKRGFGDDRKMAMPGPAPPCHVCAGAFTPSQVAPLGARRRWFEVLPALGLSGLAVACTSPRESGVLWSASFECPAQADISETVRLTKSRACSRGCHTPAQVRSHDGWPPQLSGSNHNTTTPGSSRPVVCVATKSRPGPPTFGRSRHPPQGVSGHANKTRREGGSPEHGTKPASSRA